MRSLTVLSILTVIVVTEFVEVTGSDSSANETGHRYYVASFNWSHVQAPFTIALWILLASAAKMGFQMSKRLVSIFPDSSLLIVLGLLVGLVLYLVRLDKSIFHLNSEVFFLFLLPPIVFEAGYFMPSRAFFDNFGTILVYAVIGTIWNSVTIGLSRIVPAHLTLSVGSVSQFRFAEDEVWIALKFTMVLIYPCVTGGKNESGQAYLLTDFFSVSFSLYAVSLTGLFRVSPPFLHSMLFSSLISAVDPIAVLVVFEEIHVNQILYISVFGESLLNDAVSVVLYNIFSSFSRIGQDNIISLDIVAGLLSFFVVGLGGVFIGLLWSFIVSFTTRWTSHVPILEPLFVFTMGYCAYMTAEMFHLSGILAIVFCGIAMKQYVEGNISKDSQTTVQYFMRMLSSSCETVIFMFLGMSTVKQLVRAGRFTGLIIAYSLCILIGVVLQTFIVNKFRVTKLNTVDQFIMAYGGLRGAIAYGLVVALDEKLIPAKQIFVTATIVMIYFTVFLQGMTIKPLVNFLKVKRQEQREKTMHEQMTERLLDHVCSGMEDICGLRGHHSIRDKYEYYNTKYLKPLLMRDAPKSVNTDIIDLFKKIDLKEAMDHWTTHGSFDMIASASSLSALIRSYAEGKSNDGNDGTVVEAKPILDMNIFDLEQPQMSEEMFTHRKLFQGKRPKLQFQSKALKKLKSEEDWNEEPAHALQIRPFKPIISHRLESQEPRKRKHVLFSDEAQETEIRSARKALFRRSSELTLAEKELPWKKTDSDDSQPLTDDRFNVQPVDECVVSIAALPGDKLHYVAQRSHQSPKPQLAHRSRLSAVMEEADSQCYTKAL
ncbi:sodium/hydrogen exchanger 3 [Trichuris suis]|nr:sodium/hydrogen exchanger 3 [Trichuris suis]